MLAKPLTGGARWLRGHDTAGAVRGSSLQALWPTLAAVENCDDLQTLAAESIRNDVSCAWHHQLTSPRYPPRAPDIRQLRQAIDRSE